ncbi:MAG: glycosyltransferase family 4 protein [Brevibacterium aurantiacum]|uniref:glycosyltransferase family 4 protein n=1 Tax=Brevibacterium aurantiacum TaxID=273384 RepID=UPI003F9329D5
MRILLLSHYYWPEVGAPQRRWSTLVRHFIDQGHQVIVAAPHPHYPHTRRDEFFNSKVGRRRNRVEAKLGGTWEAGEFGEWIIRVPYFHSGSSMARQLLDQGVASLGVINTSTRRMRGAHAPDVVISTTPALPYLFAGETISRILKVPHIAEVRDAWPDLIRDLSLVTNAAGRYLPLAFTGFLEGTVLPRLFTRVQQRATAVVVTTDSFRAHLHRRGINAEVVRSGVSRSEIDQALYSGPGSSDGVNLLYVGTVGRSQDLSSAIIAAARVPGVRLRIVGDGADRSNLQALASNLASPVEFLEQTTGTELADHWEWAHAGLVSLGDVPAHARTVPSKLYSLLVHQVPVLGIVAGEAAEIIISNRAGLVARPGDVDSIVTAMQALVQEIGVPGERGRQWVLENASVKVMGEEYDRILRQVCR